MAQELCTDTHKGKYISINDIYIHEYRDSNRDDFITGG